MGTQGKAIILFGHGSRDPLWRQPMDAVAARLRAQDPQVAVRCAFLELDQPDLLQVGAELAAAGVGELSILPMFLGTGRHAREDLPALAQALRQQHPGLRVTLRPPVGEDERVLDLLARIAME